MLVFAALVIFCVGMATGVMCQEHVSRRGLSYDEYMKCVQHILVEYGDNTEACKAMMDELQRYMDEPGTDIYTLSTDVEVVIRKVTDEWP